MKPKADQDPLEYIDPMRAISAFAKAERDSLLIATGLWRRRPEAAPAREAAGAPRGKWYTARQIAEAARNTLTTGPELKRLWDKRRDFYPKPKGKRGKQANTYDPRELLELAVRAGDITKAARDRALEDLGYSKPSAQGGATSDKSGS